MMSAEYVFLIRHGVRAAAWDVAESDHDMTGWRKLTDDGSTGSWAADQKGFPKTLSLASALCEQLALLGCAAPPILHSSHHVAVRTAEVHQLVLQRRFGVEVPVTPLQALTPVAHDSERDDVAQAGAAIQAIRAVLTDAGKAGGAQGVIVVGHQPSLTHIAQGLLKPVRLPAGVLPIGNSEIACVRLGEWPALLWCLTEHTPDLGVEIKAKIASKLDVAKFLLGALILNLSLYLASDLWQVGSPVEALLLGCGMVAAFMGLGFTIATLLAYDRLNMPVVFWGSTARPSATPRRWSINRPPSSHQLVMFYEMIHTWNCLFLPALACAVASLGLLVAMLAYRHYVFSGIETTLAPLLIGATLVGLLVSLVVYEMHKPRLGFDD
jgi:phosphohistidine phosphatase SixA